MKRWRAVFELTVAEQRIVLALLLVMIAVAAIRSHIERNVRPAETSAQPSPSPGIRP